MPHEEPTAVVRALFDALAAGEDPSAYATGELATLLRGIRRRT